MATHILNTEKPYFESIISGKKRFDVRKSDRNFKEGDILILKELNEKKELSGREVSVKVLYILQGGKFGIHKGYCILSIAILERIRLRI